MKIARFRVNGQVRYGIVDGEELSEIRGSIYKTFRVNGTKHDLKDAVILPPTNPSEIWCPGLNFANHLEYAAEVLGEENPIVPEHPEPWIKARSSLTGTGGPIILPLDCSGEVHYEGEAVAVIGKLCRRVTVQDAHQFVLGYTCGNDVSDRVWQRDDWTFFCNVFGALTEDRTEYGCSEEFISDYKKYFYAKSFKAWAVTRNKESKVINGDLYGRSGKRCANCWI